MRRLLRFLLFFAILAGVAAAVARVRERLATPVPLGAAAAGPGHPEAAPAAPQIADDLAEVWGIGPVYRSRLAEAGITTFAALAAADPATVAAATGVPPERAAGWIAQAAERRSG